MTLTTHALVGAAIASMMPAHPVLGIALAFGSHFLVDAIPHGDYRIRSNSIHPKIGAPMSFDKDLFLDAVTIGGDALLGIVLSMLFFGSLGHPVTVLLAACAAILPDPLQFAYTRLKFEPLISLQRFHEWIHTRQRLIGKPMLAISSQIVFAAFVVFGTLHFLA